MSSEDKSFSDEIEKEAQVLQRITHQQSGEDLARREVEASTRDIRHEEEIHWGREDLRESRETAFQHRETR